MDFLDPKKLRAHRIRLMVGYVLMAVAVGLATLVLLYQAQGFGVKQGKVIQNGLVFVSSNPSPASISLNGKPANNTNARLVLEAGSYTMKLSRDGYRDWQRALTVEGGSVEHFTYPFLVPRNLTSKPVTTYDSAPQLSTQSPDRRWLLLLQQLPGQFGVFDIYDTKDSKDPNKVQQLKQQVTLPPDIFTAPLSESSRLEVVEWSNDNVHTLLRHISGDQAEYILLNRKDPALSVNLTRALQLAPNIVLSLQDKKFDSYFLHDTTTKTLSTSKLSDPQPVAFLNGVQQFESFGSDELLYISADGAPAGRVNLKVYQNKKQYTVRQLPVSDSYLLALSRYEGAWYVMAGVAAEDRVYVYKDPVTALQRDSSRAAVPITVLKIDNPAYVAMSANSQLMMVQAAGATNFSIYDIENDRSHTYQLGLPMDLPQAHAIWMDGHHLQLTSGGKQVIFDYDGTNVQTLVAQTPAQPAYFDTGYKTLYTLAASSVPAVSSASSVSSVSALPAVPPANPNGYVLSATSLKTAADQ